MRSDDNQLPYKIHLLPHLHTGEIIAVKEGLALDNYRYEKAYLGGWISEEEYNRWKEIHHYRREALAGIDPPRPYIPD